MIIKDGTGDGFEAKVTKKKQLSVSAVSESEFHDFAEAGDGYVISSGAVAIGASGTEGILYFKNTGDGEFHVDSIGVSNDVVARWVVYRNPTAGTLISGGASVTPVNLNYNSNKTLTNTSTKGTDGSTITDGTTILTVEHIAGSKRLRLDGSMILASGNSVAIESVVGAAANLAVHIMGHFEAA